MDTNLFSVGAGLPLNISVNFQHIAILILIALICYAAVACGPKREMSRRARKIVLIGMALYIGSLFIDFVWDVGFAVFIGNHWISLPVDDSPHFHYRFLLTLIPRLLGLCLIALGTLMTVASLAFPRFKQTA